MHVGFVWDSSLFDYRNMMGNPYGGSLVEALQPHGYTFELLNYVDEPSTGVAGFSARWAWLNRNRVQAVHLHWLAGFVSADTTLGAWRRLFGLAVALILARVLGYRIIWTLHNMLPHERPHRGVDVVGRYLMAALASAIICHCRYAAKEFSRRFYRRRGLHVIPHGNFRSAYPSSITREDARAGLSIPSNAFVYLSFGNIRGYKGHDDMVDAFCELPGEHLRLVIAGSRHTSYTGPMGPGNEIDKRIVWIEDKIPIDDLQRYFNAADVAVFPYRDALTSGALITSLGFGRPVIATRVGCIPEVLETSDAGHMVPPADIAALRRAMAEAQGWDIAARSRSAHAVADQLGWEPIAELTMRAYGPP
jgi:glycosyltransferase involved in cell wall biosynthesis